MRQWAGSALVQKMAWCLLGAKPLPEPTIVAYYQLDSWKQIEFEIWNSNRNSLILIQENAFEIVVWQNGGHFVPGWRWDNEVGFQDAFYLMIEALQLVLYWIILAFSRIWPFTGELCHLWWSQWMLVLWWMLAYSEYKAIQHILSRDFVQSSTLSKVRLCPKFDIAIQGIVPEISVCLAGMLVIGF